jgi:hypothetical protein
VGDRNDSDARIFQRIHQAIWKPEKQKEPMVFRKPSAKLGIFRQQCDSTLDLTAGS